MSTHADGRPIATAGCEPGDDVVIIPIPAPGLTPPEEIHGTVTRVTDANLYVETDGGERYRRHQSGRVGHANERQTRGGVHTFWSRVAHDSELRRVETDGGPDVVDLRKHIDAALERARRNDRVELATLAFAEGHVDAILGGEKTVTLRLPEAYDQTVVHACESGSDILLTTPDGEPFARAEMRALWAATARQVAGSKLAGYPVELSSPDDVLEILRRYYGDELAGAGPTHAVDVLHFDEVSE